MFLFLILFWRDFSFTSSWLAFGIAGPLRSWLQFSVLVRCSSGFASYLWCFFLLFPFQLGLVVVQFLQPGPLRENAFIKVFSFVLLCIYHGVFICTVAAESAVPHGFLLSILFQMRFSRLQSFLYSWFVSVNLSCRHSSLSVLFLFLSFACSLSLSTHLTSGSNITKVDEERPSNFCFLPRFRKLVNDSCCDEHAGRKWASQSNVCTRRKNDLPRTLQQVI